MLIGPHALSRFSLASALNVAMERGSTCRIKARPLPCFKDRQGSTDLNLGELQGQNYHFCSSCTKCSFEIKRMDEDNGKIQKVTRV